MEELNKDLKVTIIYESRDTEVFTPGLNDSIEKVINDFSTKIKIEKSSLYLLYSGNVLYPDEYKKTFFEIMNKTDRNSKCMTILAFLKDDISELIPDSDYIKIFLIQDTKVIRLQGTKSETFKEIFEKEKAKIGNDLTRLDFIYRNKEMDINKKFLDIADKNDQKNNLLAIYINRKDYIFVNFHKENLEDRCYNSFEEQSQSELCKQYSNDINKNYKELIFTIEGKPIPREKTIGQLLEEKNEIAIEESKVDVKQTTVNKIKDMKEIDIYVSEISCCKKHKILIIILSIIAAIIIAVAIASIIAATEKNEKNEENKTCSYGYGLFYGECKIDYFLIAVYSTYQKGEKINLMNQNEDINHIFIEGKKLEEDFFSYQFEEEGDHIVYIQFREGSHTSRIFQGNKNIKSVNCTDFNEYEIKINFESMFADCTNLYSVDFSELSFGFFSDTNDMFNGCFNLKYVYIKNLKIMSNLHYMFANCKSLTSIDLSLIDSSYAVLLNNMFQNCISLQNINFINFRINLAQEINYMFYGCNSLKSIDISFFDPNNIEFMNSVFYNCISLTSINLHNFVTPRLKEVRYLFYNCSSLKEIDLSFFDTHKLEFMNNMFQGCSSLTSIKFRENLHTSSVFTMESLFSGCHSLKSIDPDIIVTKQLSILAYMFKDCYSLTSINLHNFDVSSVSRFEYMFQNCYSLEKIDVSNFYIMDSSDLTGMFYGCSLLTSIDLSNLPLHRFLINEMFYDCPKLNYVDFSSILGIKGMNTQNENDELIMNSKMFNENISQNGILVLNEDFYRNYVNETNEFCPSNWKINVVKIKNNY